MFSKSAQYYDAIYKASGKDYFEEAELIHKFIQKYKHTNGNSLLDVACGTGVHVGLLCKYYKVEGSDLDRKMLRVARKNSPKIRFHYGDMRNFDLGRQYDIVTCLFSAIGYMKTKSDLRKAIKNMSQHVLPGGILIIEPWFTPEQWHPGRIFTLRVDQPDIKLVRMSYSGKRGKVSLLEFDYLVGTSKGIKHLSEHHEFGLFIHEEYLEAFQLAGLKTTYNKKGLMGRGLYIGRKAAQ